MGQLTEQEKEKIIEEEKLRAEIRNKEEKVNIHADNEAQGAFAGLLIFIIFGVIMYFKN